MWTTVFFKGTVGKVRGECARDSSPAPTRERSSAEVAGNQSEATMQTENSPSITRYHGTRNDDHVDMTMERSSSSCDSESAASGWTKAVHTLLRQENLVHPSLCQCAATVDKSTAVCHVRQQERWDCGIACVQMVFNWLCESAAEANKDRNWMLERVGAKSIWTVDLVVLLDELIAEHELKRQASLLFCSKNLGVDESLRRMGYYHDSFDEDQKRVLQGFQCLDRRGVPTLEVARHDLDRVVRLVRLEHVIAIALVDNSILNRHRGNNPDEKIGDPGANDTYAGHYIVISGIGRKPCEEREVLEQGSWSKSRETSTKDDLCFVVHNPATDQATSYLPLDLFEEAWTAQGTDDDIVFVAKHFV